MRVLLTFLTSLGLGLCAARGDATGGSSAAIPVSSEWQFRAWQTHEGLPDNAVTGVGQAPDGYLWVATFGGLMRFNGDRFEAFSPLHLPDVANRVVHQMLLDSTGRLWLAMDRGSVVCADKVRARVITMRDGLLGTWPACMAEDGRGGIWLAYRTGVVRVSGDTVTALTTNAGFPARGNYYVATDPEGTTWIATGNELGRMRNDRWEAAQTFPEPGLRFTPKPETGWWVAAGNVLFGWEPGKEPVELARLPTQAQVQSLLTDRAGRLWIATASDGLFHWQGSRLEKVPVSHSQISSLAEDREGNLWVGTAGGGLNRLRARTMEVVGVNNGLPYESMRSICEDTNGVRWAVTDNGLLLRNPGSGWEIAGPESGWTRGWVANCVAADRDGAVWVGTANARLVRLHQGQSREWGRGQNLSSSSVRSILTTANGDVWVATSSPHRLHRLREGNLVPVLFNREVRSTLRAMAETADGSVWAGSAEGLLIRVNPATLEAEMSFPDERPLSIRSLCAAPDGSLWIGYAGWGIGRWKEGRHTRITAAHGLFDDYVSQILPDERGNLWLNSNHGLFVVRLTELLDVFDGRAERVRCLGYGRSEGLPSLQPRSDYHPSVWRMANGSLYFALRNGLAVVQAQKMVLNPSPPPVVVERVAVDERTVARYDAGFPLLPAGEATNQTVVGTDALLTVRQSIGRLKSNLPP